MDKKKSTNQELEKLLRKELEQVKQAPDMDIWKKIADRQAPRNGWLRLRHYAQYAVPAAVAVALLVAAWWYWGSEPQPAPTDILPEQQWHAPRPEVPVANAEPTAEQPAVGPTVLPKRPAPAYAAFGAMQFNSVPGTTVPFNASAGLDYQSPATGTTIRIPANSLVDAEGHPVRGPVELHLREYRSIPDFLASGIPMHFTDERGEFFFNSGGMFDLRVSQNGEPLYMAPGETYDLTFAATGALTNANMFYFDDHTGQWEYLPTEAFADKAAAKGQPARARLVSESQAARDNRRNANLPCLPQMAELPPKAHPIDFVQQGVHMGYQLATGKVAMPGWFRKRPWISNEMLLNSVERGLVRLVRNRDQGELFFPEDVNGVFTELKAFKDCYFIRSSDSVNMSKVLRTDVYWDRVSVKQDIGNRCLISLFSEKEGLLQIYANLTPSIGNKTFNGQQVLDEYERLRAERLQNLETLAETLRKFLTVAQAFQPEDEWCLSQPDWLEYFETEHPQMAKRYGDLIASGLTTNDALADSTWKNWRGRVREFYMNNDFRASSNRGSADQNLTYALRLSNFGLYNCDQIFRLGAQRDYIYATYETTDGSRIVPASVSILDRNTRLFFTLSQSNQLLHLPGRNLDLIVTGKDGRYYHFTASEYARLRAPDKGAQARLALRDVTDKTRTPRDWAEYLDM